MDDKNRVTIPSVWRQENADTFFLVPHSRLDCLCVMPPDVFREVGAKSERQNSAPNHRLLIRQLFAQARYVSIDKQGRLLLPEDYCMQVALEGEVLLAGGQDRFEIWSPANWTKSQDVEKPIFATLAAELGI